MSYSMRTIIWPKPLNENSLSRSAPPRRSTAGFRVGADAAARYGSEHPAALSGFVNAGTTASERRGRTSRCSGSEVSPLQEEGARANHLGRLFGIKVATAELSRWAIRAL